MITVNDEKLKTLISELHQPAVSFDYWRENQWQAWE